MSRAGGCAKSASPFLVFLIGSLIGPIEIVSRHSDYRFAAAIKIPAIAYIALNGVLCVVALWLINATQPAWLGFDPAHSDGDQVRIVLTAGFGASAFFRTSIFKLKTPDGERGGRATLWR